MNIIHAFQRFIFFGIILVLTLLVAPSAPQAGCGCLKPPPPPPLEPLTSPVPAPPPIAPRVSVLPHMAYPGMMVSIFSPDLNAGEIWQVTFQSGTASVTKSVPVSLKWDLWDINADGTRKVKTPRLVTTLPPNLPFGPASITINHSSVAAPLEVPSSEFTVIGKPVMVAEQTTKLRMKHYSTAVGTVAVDKYVEDGQEKTRVYVAPEGRLYLTLGGLDKVCQPMRFKALLKDTPIRFSYGDVSIINTQGFLVESLGPETSTHFTPRSNAGNSEKSDRFDYWRHSFADYCEEHQDDGAKQIDPEDPYWHLDGTPHVDYATLIFVLTTRQDDNSLLPVGASTLDLRITTEVDDGQEEWLTYDDMF